MMEIMGWSCCNCQTESGSPARITMSSQVPWLRLLFLIALMSTRVLGNLEGDALNAFRQNVIDSSRILESWDPTAPNPCNWLHVTCNAENSVVRLDLGNSGLSGILVPQLGVLTKLQYLELYSNNLSGPIPVELGTITPLVSLDLYQNNFTGTIPDSLGQLSHLRFLRLNNNSLTGSIPVSLTTIQGLQILDLSYNELSGDVPSNGSFLLFTSMSFLGNNNLCGSVVGKQCPQFPPPPLNVSGQQGPANKAEAKNWKVIVAATTSSAIILVFVILSFIFILHQNRKYTQDFQRRRLAEQSCGGCEASVPGNK